MKAAELNRRSDSAVAALRALVTTRRIEPRRETVVQPPDLVSEGWGDRLVYTIFIRSPPRPVNWARNGKSA